MLSGSSSPQRRSRPPSTRVCSWRASRASTTRGPSAPAIPRIPGRNRVSHPGNAGAAGSVDRRWEPVPAGPRLPMPGPPMKFIPPAVRPVPAVRAMATTIRRAGMAPTPVPKRSPHPERPDPRRHWYGTWRAISTHTHPAATPAVPPPRPVAAPRPGVPASFSRPAGYSRSSGDASRTGCRSLASTRPRGGARQISSCNCQ